ncbi:MAG TPA: S24/S26 family peptidase [Pyrinomonadaceae bacterium]|jgi:hypothetical protein
MSEAFQSLSAGLLAEGYGIRFQARGTSMLPLIGSDEIIIVEPVLTRRIRRGDILLYRRRSGVRAHRVLMIEKRDGRALRLTLKGDSSATADDPITPAEIMGRVVAVERDGRSVRIAGRRARLRWRLRQYANHLRTLRARVMVIRTSGRALD